MVRQHFFLILFTIAVNTASSQSPEIEAEIMSRKSAWIKIENFVNAYDPALKPAQFRTIYKTVDSFAAFFKEALPQAVGGIGKWKASIFGKPLFPGAPSPYSMSAYLDYYYYNHPGKKIMTAGETATWFYIFANGFNWLLQDHQVKLLEPLANQTIWELPPEFGEWNDLPVFQPLSFAPWVKVIVLTRDGSIPWKYVTRLQYLTALRAKIESDHLKRVATYDDGLLKNQRLIEDLQKNKDMSPDMKSKLIAAAELNGRKLAEDRVIAVQLSDNLRDGDLSVVDNFLNNKSAALLTEPAVINTHHAFVFQNKFEVVTDKSARKLVYIDQSYFNTRIPSWHPQLLTIMLRWNANAPGLNFKNEIETRLPLVKLRAMLR